MKYTYNSIKYTVLGFSIIEFLLYLVIVSSIILLITRFACFSVQGLQLHNQRNQSIASLAAAVDFMLSYVCTAPGSLDRWKERGPSVIVYNATDSYDYGFLVENNCLMRYQGLYNSITRNWSIINKSVIVDHCGSAVFTLYEKQDKQVVVGCSCILTSTFLEADGISPIQIQVLIPILERLYE